MRAGKSIAFNVRKVRSGLSKVKQCELASPLHSMYEKFEELIEDRKARATGEDYEKRQNGAPQSAQRAMTHASQIQKFLFSASPVIYQTSFFFSILEKKEFFSKLNKLCSHLINSIEKKNFFNFN